MNKNEVKMNKINFFKNLKTLYGSKTSNDGLDAQLKAYNCIINEVKQDIDYDKLNKLVLKNWEYATIMPTTKFINEQIQKAIIYKKDNKKNHFYDCIILEDFEPGNYKKGQNRTGFYQDLIDIKKNGVKFKVINVDT